MITVKELLANWHCMLSAPIAPPGIGGKLISKCKAYRKDWIANKGQAFGYPTVYVIGKQIYMLTWSTLGIESKVVFFRRRKEASIEDPDVQTALEANLVMQRMTQEKQQVDWGQWAQSSGLGQWTSQTAVISSPYGVTPQTYTTSNTYPNATAQMQQYWSMAQAQTQNPYSGTSTSWNSLRKMLGMP